MPIKKYIRRIAEVEAMQLVVNEEAGIDNAQEIAAWCGGMAAWTNDPVTGIRTVTVIYDFTEIVSLRLVPGSWMVRNKGLTYVMTDESFRTIYNTDVFKGPVTCNWCLSDPKYTPMGDPGEKRCPVCGVRYSGPKRGKEYNVLKAAGLVEEEV